MEKDVQIPNESFSDSEKFKKGDYNIHVFIEESKGLLPMTQGSCFNPVISVSCFGKSKCSRKLKDVFTTHTSFWNEHIYFSKLSMTVEELESSKVLIEVLDSSTLKDSLIGCYEFDFTYIYFKPKHSIIHQWVILSNPYSEDMSVQRGLIKLGINIIHENDKAEDLTVKSISDSLIIPPQVSVKSMQLIIQFIQAFNLPKMDSMGTCDTYCMASFSTSKLKTKVDVATESTMSSHWFQELWLPVCQPNIANKVNITIWDKDMTADELVGSLNFSWDSIKHDKEAEFVWANIYGAHDNLANEVAESMNFNEKSASNWRGRILLKLFKRETDKALLKVLDIGTQQLRQLVQEQFETEDDFQINAQVFEAVNLPFDTGSYSIMVKFSGKSILSKQVAAEAGNCKWYENIKRAVIGIPPQSVIPDIFVYLMYSGKPICFARLNPGQFENPKPREKWIKLTPDMSIGTVKNSWEGGYVLMRVFVGPIACPDYDKKFWDAKIDAGVKMVEKNLVCYLYQCRNLPAADSTGLADPYVKVICGKSYYVTDKQAKLEILNPLWYETFSLKVNFTSVQTAPPVIIQVWDFDLGQEDDMMGFVIVNMTEIPEYKGEVPRPKWYPLNLGSKDTEEGEILISFMLVDGDPPPFTIPTLREVEIEIYALGFRGLKPALGWLPVNKPFLKVDVRGMQLPGEQSLITELTTQPNNPGANPNIGSVLKFKTKIPEDPLFCPNLSCTVNDFLLSGKSQPILGTFNLGLHQEYEKGLTVSKAKKRSLEPKPVIREITEEVVDSESDALLSSTSIVPEPVTKPVVTYTFPLSLSEAQNPGTVVLMPQFKPSSNPRQSKQLEIPFNDVNYMQLGYNRTANDGKKHYRYMLAGTLEKSQLFGEPPFKIYPIRKGQIRGAENQSWFSNRKALGSEVKDYSEAGVFKGIVRIKSKLNDVQDDGSFDIIAKQLLTKTNVLVRVYVIDAFNLEQMDMNSPSDPYLIIKLGKEKISDRENYQEDESCPKFLKHFDISTTFPGDSTLKVQAWDHESILADKKIGTLKIDLEDRFFNDSWASMPEKPIEKGKLIIKTSKQPRGFIRYWVEIHPALSVPQPWDLNLKPPEPYELRLIVWRSEEVPNMDSEGVSDLYLIASVNNGDKCETDTHYRALNGQASWNWRMKFKLMLDEDSKVIANLSLWDRDLLSANDPIGSHSLDLTEITVEAVRTGEKQVKVGSPEKWVQRTLRQESEKFFVNFEKSNPDGTMTYVGKVLVSVEVLPQARADACKNGEGRSEPNLEPALPAPEGRVQLTMNPVKMITQMVGPELKRKVMIWCCVVLCAMLCVFMLPMVLANGFSAFLFY